MRALILIALVAVAAAYHQANAPHSACLQEKVKGPCRAIYHRYFFNKETGKCEKFIYGGCLGNDNNFSSKDDCEAVCLETVIPQKHCKPGEKLCVDGTTCIPGLLLCDGIQDCPDGSDEKYGCEKAKFCGENFYFCQDKTDPPCISREKVCDGIKDCSDGSDESLCDKCPDNFCKNGGTCSVIERKPICQCKKDFLQNRCGSKSISAELHELQQSKRVSQQSTRVEACDLPAETGVCYGYFPRFYFDRTTGKCRKFVYGGCGGNKNNFETIEECQRTCASAAPSACLQDKVTGPCEAYFERYFFNKDTGKCEKFIYGGCRGNSNNFSSQEDCEAVCLA